MMNEDYIGKWGIYLLSLLDERSVAHVHPDDQAIFASTFQHGCVHTCVGIENDYLVIAYGRVNYRVKSDYFVTVPAPKFKLGEEVIIPKYADQKAFIRDIMWHSKNSTHNYYVTLGGKKKSKRYYAEDLYKLKD